MINSVIIYIFSMSITMLIYWQIDKRVRISQKINSLIKLQQAWKSTIFVIGIFVFIFLLSLMQISNQLHSLLFGIILGISISIISNLNKFIKK